MALTYSQLIGVKNRVESQLETHENNLDACVSQFTAIKNALMQMQTDYSGWAQEVDDFLVANPTDEAAKVLKAQKDAIVAEFQSKKARATSLETAVNGI